jgi:hypothetical protein
MVACREALSDGNEWSFYLINDSDTEIASALLSNICYEWGDFANNELVSSRVTNMAAGEHALLWRDDGSGAELRMIFSVLAYVADREISLSFEFPRLYRLQNPKLVPSLNKMGWEQFDEG